MEVDRNTIHLKEQNEKPLTLIPGRLSGNTHLKNTGILIK